MMGNANWQTVLFFLAIVAALLVFRALWKAGSLKTFHVSTGWIKPIAVIIAKGKWLGAVAVAVVAGASVWYVFYLFETAAPLWAAEWRVSGGPSEWVLFVGFAILGAIGTSTKGTFRKALFIIVGGPFAIVITYYLAISYPGNLWFQASSDRPRLTANFAATSPASTVDCPGIQPDPDRPISIGWDWEMRNPGKECAYTWATLTGRIELDSSHGIPEKVRCVSEEPCMIYELLCPFGKGPHDDGWQCRPA